MHTRDPALHTLQREWLLVAVGYGLALLAGYWALADGWVGGAGSRWLLIAALVAARPLWWLRRRLAHNHPPGDDRLLPHLGWGNAITLFRGLLIAWLAGFVFTPTPTGIIAWLPALLYMTIALLDGVDGFVARATDHVTVLGGELDIELDGMGVLIAVLVGISLGRLPLWYLPLGFSRELFVIGIWLRERRGLPVRPLTPSNQRRLVAGMQMGFLGIILWPIFEPPATTLATLLFGAQLLASFGRDWLVVSNTIDPESEWYQRWRDGVKRVLLWWLPLPLRLLGAGLTGLILLREVPDFSGWLPYWSALGWPASTAALWALTLLASVALLLLAFGVGARVVAVALLALALFDQAAVGFVWPTNGLLQLSTILLAQLGGGMWAVYRVLGDT